MEFCARPGVDEQDPQSVKYAGGTVHSDAELYVQDIYHRDSRRF